MGKLSEKKRATKGTSSGSEKLQALEAKREVLLEELQRVEERIRQVRNAEPVPKSGCQAHADTRESGSPNEGKPPRPRVDRSKWPPKLRKLVEENWPEAGREERIRRATEKPRPKIEVPGLTKEELRYYAEDVDLEYDV